MTVGELMNQLSGVPSNTLVCAAEVDEAFGINIASLEIVDKATINSRESDGMEGVELDNGSETVVVLRW